MWTSASILLSGIWILRKTVLTVTDIHLLENGKQRTIHLEDSDLCIMTNGCMTVDATLGDFKTPHLMNRIRFPAQAVETVAEERPVLGDQRHSLVSQETNGEEASLSQ